MKPTTFSCGRMVRPWAIAVLALSASLFLTEMEPAMSAKEETEAANKAIVAAGFESWRNGTGSPYDLLDEDATWTIVGHSDASKTYRSREAFLSEVIRPFNARMQVALKPTIRQLYADGDAVIIFFDAAGTARDGQPYENTYAWLFRMREGKVVEGTAFFDSTVFNDFWRRVPPAASNAGVAVGATQPR